MYPEIFRIGKFAVRSWGLLCAIGFAAGLFVAHRRAKKTGVDPNIIPDMLLVILISSMLGSRVFYVIFHLNEFKGNWLATINPFGDSGTFGISGLSMMGGVVLAIVSAWIYTYVKKLKFTEVGDTLAPGFLIGASLTRIGCFLNGCCYGRPTESFIGMIFPSGSPAGYAFPGVHIHPTQLYASLLGLCFFLAVIYLDKYRNFSGFTTWLVLMLYSIDRFIVDMFRNFEMDQVLFQIGKAHFSVNEIVVISIFVFSLFMFIRGYLKSKNA